VTIIPSPGFSPHICHYVPRFFDLISYAAPPTYEEAVGYVEVAQEATELDDVDKAFEKVGLP
jgi:hypothetical protein